MRRIARKCSANWQTRVRWRDDAGHTSEHELHVDRLPAPFATFSHPDVAEAGRWVSTRFHALAVARRS